MLPQATEQTAQPHCRDGVVHPVFRELPLRIDRVIEDHHRSVYGYALRLVGDINDAEDLTQQTFLIAHQRLDQLRHPERVRGWLLAIVRSCFLKMGRRKRPICETSAELDVSQVSQVLCEPTSIDPGDLQTALAQLSDEHRLILTMYYFEHLTYRQIAEQLDVKIGTVMSRLSRAKSKLRGLLLAGGWNRE